jgi:membrane-bound lytic murein transglycosylase F
MVLGQGPVESSGEAGTFSAIERDAPRSSMRDAWSLQAGGWYIQVERPFEEMAPKAEPIAPRRPAVVPLRHLSPYDHLIQRHARAKGFDWRLIAALIFEESRFNPTSRSPRGAYGLMQVRPIAARAVGSPSFYKPDDNIRTGVLYLGYLRKLFDSAQGDDRRRLMLAAYHMGPGHVRDAQSLALQLGYDPYRWETGLKRVLPLLERPDIYDRLPNGYAKGKLTVSYVERVLQRFKRYQSETMSLPVAGAPRRSSPDADA